MTLDPSEVKKIAKDEAIGLAITVGAHIERNSCNSEMLTSFTEYELLAFAQAIYAMGAADQKEKDAKICEELKSKIFEYSDRIVIDTAKNVLTNCAKAIRSQE